MARPAARKLARELTAHAQRHARQHSTRPLEGVVREITPLQVELTTSALVLDGEDLLLGQLVRFYDDAVGIAIGDTLIVLPMPSGEFVVIEVISDNDPPSLA